MPGEPQTISAHYILFRPVVDSRTGKTILIDIFVDDVWIGSRRTIEQARQAAHAHAR